MKISNIYGILFILHLVLTISIQPANAQSCTKAPASFEDNRIYLEVKAGNETLKFYTDSGGGLFPFVYADTAKKLDMNIKKTENKNGIKVGYSTLPKTLKQQNIPLSNEWENKVRIFESGEEIKTEASEIRFMIGDGFFGASLFAGRIWHFNYGTKQLLYCSQLQDTTRFSVISLFFKEFQGKRMTLQPRIEIEIDGTPIQVLFDTGATSFYSPEAVADLRPLKPFTASSFIRKSIAENWIKRHPNWKVIKNGEKFSGGGDLVEVPQLKIAGHSVGPVWFATRKDEIYDKYSNDFMDSQIDGAVGGNFLKAFDIIMDYPDAKLYLRKLAL